MIVDQVIAALDYLFGDLRRNTFRLGPVRISRVEAIHAFSVDRVHVRNLLLKRGNIHQRKNDHSAGDLGGIKRLNQLFQRNDGGILRSVRAGNQRQHWPRFRAVEDCHGNGSGGIAARRNFNSAE